MEVVQDSVSKLESRVLATRLAKQELGGKEGADKVKVYDIDKVQGALDKGVFAGKVLAVTKSHVAQSIGENKVILHDKDKLNDKFFEKGANYTLEYKNGRGQMTELNKSRDVLKQSLSQTYGDKVRVFGPENLRDGLEKGSFSGTVVAKTEHHVAQRIAADKIVLHKQMNLPKQEFEKTQIYNVSYQNGRAQVQKVEQQQARKVGLER